jgi:hypothetical protein
MKQTAVPGQQTWGALSRTRTAKSADNPIMSGRARNSSIQVFGSFDDTPLCVSRGARLH